MRKKRGGRVILPPQICYKAFKGGPHRFNWRRWVSARITTILDVKYLWIPRSYHQLRRQMISFGLLLVYNYNFDTIVTRRSRLFSRKFLAEPPLLNSSAFRMADLTNRTYLFMSTDDVEVNVDWELLLQSPLLVAMIQVYLCLFGFPHFLDYLQRRGESRRATATAFQWEDHGEDFYVL